MFERCTISHKEIWSVAEYFVSVDACVVIDLYVETIAKGAIPKEWDELKALVASGGAKLLVPEIIVIEFRKWVRKRLEALPNAKFKIIPPSGNESFDAVVNEQLAKILQTPLDEWIKKTGPDWQAAFEKVLNSLSDGEPIEFTSEIEHRTKRRLIEELYVKRKESEKRDQDCFIIDSLVDYFEKNHGGNVDDKILVFGTKDRGFGELKKEAGTEMADPTGMLHKSFQGGLPPTKVFTSLGDLVKFVKSKGTINFLKGTEPAAQEEEEQEVPVMVEIEEPVAAPKHYVLDAEPGRFGLNETVVSVPSSGGRVIDIVVRDHVTGSDSLEVTSSTTTTSTTPPPSGHVEVFGGDWLDYAASQGQRRADELARIRQDEERRRRNAQVNLLPPSFFSPPPETKTARIGLRDAGALAGQDFKRWIDPAGVAWQLSFSSVVPVTGEQPPHVLITLDRRNADSCTENVSEACDRFLRSLRFSYQRVVPQRRQGGVSFGPYVIEEQEPERPVGNPFDPNEGLRAIEDAVKSGGRPNPEPKPEEPKKEPEPPEEPPKT
jgi:hypothetical protein